MAVDKVVALDMDLVVATDLGLDMELAQVMV